MLHFPRVIPFLGAVDFLEVTARTFDKCDQFRGLELETYSGDLRALTVEIKFERRRAIPDDALRYIRDRPANGSVI